MQQRANSRNDGAGPGAVIHNFRNDLLQLLEIRRLTSELAQAEIAVRDDCGQGLVDLVSNRGNQFSHRQTTADASKVSLRLIQFIFGTLTVGDFSS